MVPVVRMQMLHPKLEGLEALLPVRGKATEVAIPVIDEDAAVAEVVNGWPKPPAQSCQALTGRHNVLKVDMSSAPLVDPVGRAYSPKRPLVARSMHRALARGT
jgi:hypothetical protein